LVQFLNSW